MRLLPWIVVAMMSAMLMACQTISASKAASMPMLAALPLLTVKTVHPTAQGYTAELLSEGNEAYLVTVNQSAVKDYVRLAAGDRVKVDGDYADENPVKITAIQVFKIR